MFFIWYVICSSQACPDSQRENMSANLARMTGDPIIQSEEFLPQDQPPQRTRLFDERLAEDFTLVSPLEALLSYEASASGSSTAFSSDPKKYVSTIGEARHRQRTAKLAHDPSFVVEICEYNE
jgi:hypothetical protein